MLTPDLDSWTLNEESELFRRIGTKLEERYESGEDTDYAAIIYEISDEIVNSSGKQDDYFGDELSDAANNGIVGDGIWGCHKGHLIWASFENMPGSFGGIDILDFGTGKLFVMEAPDEDLGTDWQLQRILDPTPGPNEKTVSSEVKRSPKVTWRTSIAYDSYLPTA